ncbi:hypothetical protein PLCT1_01508 [Planctomycetaceae bacterium]|nr:hypothetical protein PLCT1_01508 [Planctomycetaceae bacterium]
MDNVRKLSLIVLAAVAVMLAAGLCAPPRAHAGYSPFFRPVHDKNGALRIIIRKLTGATGTRYLAVDPESFETAFIDEAMLGEDAPEAEWRRTPYAKAIEKYNSPSPGLQDSGLRRAGNGLFLTVDLCPSTKKMDTGLFMAAIRQPRMKDTPLPVAIAVSGTWMERHEDELAWILGMERKGELSITWVNHSFTHPYDREKPLEENFLLKAGVDFEREVLEEERALVSKGLLPSPFFRFPGLVADKGLLERLKRLFLIPIGADAWLAKGGKPVDGSIILVHGNGNEPEGTKRLIEFYGSRKKAFEMGELRFLPL